MSKINAINRKKAMDNEHCNRVVRDSRYWFKSIISHSKVEKKNFHFSYHNQFVWLLITISTSTIKLHLTNYKISSFNMYWKVIFVWFRFVCPFKHLRHFIYLMAQINDDDFSKLNIKSVVNFDWNAFFNAFWSYRFIGINIQYVIKCIAGIILYSLNFHSLHSYFHQIFDFIMEKRIFFSLFFYVMQFR